MPQGAAGPDRGVQIPNLMTSAVHALPALSDKSSPERDVTRIKGNQVSSLPFPRFANPNPAYPARTSPAKRSMNAASSRAPARARARTCSGFSRSARVSRIMYAASIR